MKNFRKIHIQSLFNPYPVAYSEPVSEERKKAINREFIDNCIVAPYNQFLNTGAAKILSPSTAYRWLEQRGYVNLTEDERAEIESRARAECYEYHKTTPAPTQAARAAIRELLRSLEEGEGDEHWMPNYQHMAIIATFKQWQEQQIDINTISNV
jgi:hypothetical protein